MIPEAAVEAALRAAEDRYRADDPQTWEEIARSALEAAAPHMLAEAWEAAYGLGYADRNVGAAPTRANPYRSQA